MSVTLAPPMTAFEGSVILPVIVPSVDCARTNSGVSKNRRVRATLFMEVILLDLNELLTNHSEVIAEFVPEQITSKSRIVPKDDWGCPCEGRCRGTAFRSDVC